MRCDAVTAWVRDLPYELHTYVNTEKAEIENPSAKRHGKEVRASRRACLLSCRAKRSVVETSARDRTTPSTPGQTPGLRLGWQGGRSGWQEKGPSALVDMTKGAGHRHRSRRADRQHPRPRATLGETLLRRQV